MIRIETDGPKVVVTITAQHPIGGTLFRFDFNSGQEYIARMVAHNLDTHLWSTVEKIRKQAYEQGWSDKQRRQRKSTWFSGALDTKYPFG